jgi:glucose/arabinose dehydrogenase
MDNSYRRAFISAIIFSVLFQFTFAQPVLNFQPVITSGLNSPVDIANAGDGTKRVFIVERSGTVKVFDSNLTFIKNFLTVTGISCCGEEGLLSIAFHPNYAVNRYFFVYYTNASGGVDIARYQTAPTDSNTADTTSKVVLLSIPKPVFYVNHNGGDLNFGPDGNLYFGLGDSGSGNDPGNLAQQGNYYWGKMLRINVDDFATSPYYTIPPDNPYITAVDTLHEIWSFGLRNPWRWSFDRLNGDMYIADVGQGAWEEIDYRPSGNTGGRNFGWRCYEGNHPNITSGCRPQNTYDSAVFEYGHNSSGGISVTGGFVYRGSQYPLLYGYYIFADYQSRNGWVMRRNGTGTWVTTPQTVPTEIVSFGETENGELYMSTLTGTIYKVTATSNLPVRLISFTGTAGKGFNELFWETATEQNVKEYEIEYSHNGTFFQQGGVITATGNRSYRFKHYGPGKDNLFYRLKMVDNDLKFDYSKIISIKSFEYNKDAYVLPTIITNHNLRILLDEPFSDVLVFDLNGKEILRQNISGRMGTVNIPLPSFMNGNYMVRIIGKGKTMIEKIILQ